MQKLIKTHKLTLTIASALAIVALVTGLAFIAPTADAVPAAMVKQINSYSYPGGPYCGYQRHFCDGSVVTSSGFYGPPSPQHFVTTYLNQCGGGGEF